MAELNFPNRTFAVMDNLRLLEAMPDESVDLISIDPPFGKMEPYRRKAKPPITEFEKAEERDLFRTHGLSLDNPQHKKQLMVEGGSKVDDIFTWNGDISSEPSHQRFYGRIERADEGSMARRVHRVIEAVRETVGDNQAAYICFMAVRLVHCHRVLKDTGSVYVHCDYKSDSHLRMLLDAIFGHEKFRNGIAWCYSGGGIPRKDFPRKHDTILRYTKSDDYIFNVERKPYKENTQEVGIHSTYSGPDNKIDLARGTPITDWWTDIPTVTGWSPQRTGYATQKPLDLAKRIIEASSNPGDLAVDLFAGCATTLVAAEVTGRRWLGCDWAYRAWTMNKRRFVANPEEYGGPMRLTDTTDATLRALGLEGAQMALVQSQTIGPPDIADLPSHEIDWAKLAVAESRRVDRTWAGRYTKAEAKDMMLDAWGVICWGCGWEPMMPDGVTPNPFYLQVDHSLARSLGGEDELYNLGLLCPECNARKSSREMEILELRLENTERNAIHMSLAELNKRVPLLRVRKWARVKMDERPRRMSPKENKEQQ